MHRETISILHARVCKTIGRVLTVLVFSTAFLQPDLAIGADSMVALNRLRPSPLRAHRCLSQVSDLAQCRRNDLSAL